MGKRKSRTSKMLQKPKKQMKIETEFSCGFCGIPNCVKVSFDRKQSIATLECSMCFESFSSHCHHLTEPIDVYHEWIDECAKANPDLTTDQ